METGKINGKQIRTKFNEYDFIAGAAYVKRKDHWCLFFVSIKDAEITYLDSLKYSTKEGKKAAKDKQSDVLANWITFSKTRNGLKDKEWKLKEFTQHYQQDAYSCGVFVCKYFENLINGEPELIRNYFDLQQYRVKIR